MEKCYVFDQTASGLIAFAKLRGKAVRFAPEPKEAGGPVAGEGRRQPVLNESIVCVYARLLAWWRQESYCASRCARRTCEARRTCTAVCVAYV